MPKYTVRQLLLLNNAIDGLEKLVLGAEGQPIMDADNKCVGHKHLGYGLKMTFHVVTALAKGKIEPFITAYGKSRRDNLADKSGGKGQLASTDPKWIDFERKDSEDQDAEVELEFKTFKVSELPQVETETTRLIPGGLLAALAPILEFPES